MKISLLFIALISLILTLVLGGIGAIITFATWDTYNSNRKTETRTLSSFKHIVVEGNGTVDIRYGNKEEVTIEASEEFLKNAKTEVRNDTLYISDKKFKIRFFDFSESIKYIVTVKEITSIDMKGIGNLHADEINTGDFTLNTENTGDTEINTLKCSTIQINSKGTGNTTIHNISSENINLYTSGIGDIKLSNINSTNLVIDMTGTGELYAKGKVDTQKLTKKGIGDYNAKELISENADIKSSGTGDVTISVKKILHIEQSGVGDISYYGNPMMTINKSGIGDINKKGDL